MLDVPPVPNLTAEGLASKAVEIFRDFGFTDDQLEGMGWDGEYVKKNVKDKLVEQLVVDGMTKQELSDWLTQVWEPAHQLELVTKDTKADAVFQWFDNHIDVINDITEVLGPGAKH